MSAVAAKTGEAILRLAIHDSNQDPIPRDIVLNVCLDAHGTEAFLRHLYREMEIYAPLLARDRQIVNFTLAGAGLAHLDATQRADLLQSFAQHFALARSVMVSAEQSPNLSATKTPADCDVLGLGLGAVSRFGACQSTNARDLANYNSALDAGQLPIIDCRWDEPPV